MKNTEMIFTAARVASKGKSSCEHCNHNYCCVGQKHIEISSNEWTDIKKHITPQQEVRALRTLRAMNDESNPEKLFDCPFNNNDEASGTGMCEIYDKRFFVCAQYHVMNDKEDCNSKTEKGLLVLNPMLIWNELSSKPEYLPAMKELERYANGYARNMIDCWREHLEKKGVEI